MGVATAFHISVDWRWQRVLDLDAAKASASRSRDDRWVQRAYNYQKRKALLNIRTEARLTAAYPDIHLAFEIHSNQCSHFKWIIEAAVLANVSREELSEYLAIPVKVIEAYEMLYFDVRGKLKAKGYVAGSILGPIFAAGVSGNDPDGFWKVLAFNGGWEHVQGCWSAGKATEVAVAFYKVMATQQLMIKAAATGLAVQPNSYNSVDLIKVGMERVQYEEEHVQSIGSDQISMALRALVSNIHVRIRSTKIQLSAEEPRLQLPHAADIYAQRHAAKKAKKVKEPASD